MVLEKRLCPSAKISHTVSCNISLYCDTKEVIYQYTQNVYRCISSMYTKWNSIFEYLSCHILTRNFHIVYIVHIFARGNFNEFLITKFWQEKFACSLSLYFSQDIVKTSVVKFGEPPLIYQIFQVFLHQKFVLYKK